jgi:hypothetical protein
MRIEDGEAIVAREHNKKVLHEFPQRLIQWLFASVVVVLVVASLTGCAAFRDRGADPRDFFERLERRMP